MELGHVIDNLKDVLSLELGNKRVFDKDVAYALGLSRESFSHLKRRNSVPYEAIVFFCAKRAISINWILFDQLPKSLEEKTERFARIKYFKELHTSAGGGAWNDEEGFEYMYIHYEGLNSFSHAQEASLHAINVIGDSMEPTLKDKEIILCDTTCKEFEDGDIFMIHTLEGLFVKRLFQDAKGTISLRSDNPNYTPTCINKLGLDDITLIGKVIAKVEKELCR